MFYLIAGIIELISMAVLSLFHSGMIANISGMVMDCLRLAILPVCHISSRRVPVKEMLRRYQQQHISIRRKEKHRSKKKEVECRLVLKK